MQLKLESPYHIRTSAGNWVRTGARELESEHGHIKDAHRTPSQLRQILIQDDTAKFWVLANKTWSFLLFEKFLSQNLSSLSPEAGELWAGPHTKESRLVAEGRCSFLRWVTSGPPRKRQVSAQREADPQLPGSCMGPCLGRN